MGATRTEVMSNPPHVLQFYRALDGPSLRVVLSSAQSHSPQWDWPSLFTVARQHDQFVDIEFDGHLADDAMLQPLCA
jgi:hypothetical protein